MYSHISNNPSHTHREQPRRQAGRVRPDFTSDADAFVDTARAAVRRLGPSKTRGAALSHDLDHILLMIWLVARCGVQWRVVSRLGSVPWMTVYGHFWRWSRLGVWRALARHLASVTAANVNDRTGFRMMHGDLAAHHPAVHTVLGDIGYSGQDLCEEFARGGGINLKTTRCGDAETGRLKPTEIRWVVEQAFAWLAQWRRPAVCYERNLAHYADFAWIASASIVAARLRRTTAPSYVNMLT